MKLLSLIVCLILTVSYIASVQAVTDAELEALEKQIEQQEAEEKKEAEAKAKRKAEEKRKAKAEAKRKAEEEVKRKAEAEAEKQAKVKRKEEERIAEMSRTLKKELALTGEMVNIPAGNFRMGDINSTGWYRERPVHTVNISSFKMGKHEVTFDQWDACATDGGCNGYNPRDKRWGRGKRPVIYVSWDDAQSFVNWLNKKTSGGYRMPSEAEWEYAARAETETQYPWGNDIGQNHANCKGCGSRWGNIETAPVGSFPTNAFGLHDMHGNVFEWTQDCWNNNYDGAPSDGLAWTSGKCSERVFRGGSWRSELINYSPYRFKDITTFRENYVGFRLAQDL
jgi:formylglycine-generating enzyme required for sulfatase activity